MCVIDMSIIFYVYYLLIFIDNLYFHFILMLLNVFTANRFSIFRRLLTQYKQTNEISSSISSSSSSSTIKLGSTMKQLIDSKQYQKALDLFDQESKISSNIIINLALKACTKLNDYQRGMKIQQQLSSKSLENPFIQTSLIHFYSKSFIYYLNYN